MIYRAFVAAGLFLIVLTTSIVQATTTPPGFEDTLVASVLSPTGLAFTPDGRLLITQQTGKLRVLQNGSLLATAAVDFAPGLCTNSERGLLGVAVDPAFATNHFIYLYYTFSKYGVCEQNTSRSPVNRVSRLVLPDSNVIDRTTEVVLVDNIPSPNGNHNGGDLHFGKDGYLYISIGDGGCDYLGNSGCAGANDASRDQNVLLGKLLRITRDGGIPPDNPFQGTGSARCNVNGRTTAGLRCQETYGWGFRNPFRFATDPNAAGTRIFVNDVGQSTWEEVDLLSAGADYGWNVREGFCANGSTSDCGAPPPGMTNPVFAYNHNDGCASITGGAFVPNGVWPAEYTGVYLIADYVCGEIFTLRQQADGWYTRAAFVTDLGNNSATAMIFGPHGSTQALYYTSYAGGGQVRRIAYANNRTPTAVATGAPVSGAVPLTVRFDASGSSDPDGDPLTYDWDFLDGTAHATGAIVSHTYNTSGQFDATVTVTDSHNASATASVRVNVGNNPPVPRITSPTSAARFAVGDSVTLTGMASDVEQGTLPDSALSWTVLLHHDSHTHPFLGPTTGNGIVFTAPAPEDFEAAQTSYLEIRLTATDAAGASATVIQRFDPQLVNLTLATNPAGFTVVANNLEFQGPTTVTSWAGYVLRLEAGIQNDANGAPWLPTGWSDGGASVHTIVTPAVATTYTASFAAATRLGSLADTFARGGTYAATNFGSRQTLEVNLGADTTGTRETYLRFDLRTMATIGTARLRLYGGINDTRSVNLPVTIQGVSNNTWTETGLTWNNRPASSTAILATALIADAIPAWHEWDITSYLQSEKAAGRNVVNLVLRGATTSSLSYIGFASRQYPLYAPELLVAAAAAPNRPPVAAASATPLSGPTPLAVRFDASASSDPDGDVLSYDWNFLDGTAHATGAIVNHTYTASGQFDAVVTVTDTHGSASTATVRITAGNVGNTPPVPQITAPATSARFAVGQVVTLQGSATDAQDGALPNSALSWTVIVHHDTHTHVLLGPSAGNGITFTAPAPEDLATAGTGYLEIQLTAKDSAGATTMVSQRFDPHLVDVTLSTNPGGLTVSANDVTVAGPATITSWEGYALTLTASTQDDTGGQPWIPGTWSDGGAATHTVVTPAAPVTYLASFSPATVITVMADTFVRGGTYAAANFGTRQTVEVDQSTDASSVRETYLRFDLRTVATIGTARLRLYGAVSDARSVNVPINVLASSNTSWTETGLTWNTRPAATTAVLATTTIPDATPRWHEWDLTAYLQGERAAGRNVVTLIIRSGAATMPYIGFTSREYPAAPPRLLVTAAGS